MKTYQKLIFTFFVVAVLAVNGCAQSPTTSPTPTATTTPTPRQTSAPTTLPYQSLQPENLLPIILLSPKMSQDLPDNHIGIFTEGYDRYSDTMEQVYRNGFKSIRIQSLTDFWGGVNEYKAFSLESIPPEVDEIISDYADNGVTIVLDLWMGAGLEPYGATFQSEQEINRYLDYTSFVVPHFKGRIHYYQIWNEPADIAVKDYANLVERVVPIIRDEDPDARIIIGSIGGSWENGYPGYGEYQRSKLYIDYLNGLLRSGVVDMVDGISWGPFFDNIPSDPYYQNYPQMVQGIKDLAASQGFTGEYFADAIMWRTVTEAGWDGGPPVSEHIAAIYYTRAIAEHRGLGVNIKINTFFQKSFLAPIHNLNDILAGAEPTDITLSLASEAANVRQYAFELPNGDRLLALWTNGIAVEDDPGIETTITLPGFSASKVIGIDILNGFEQDLIAETENGNLIIQNLLVKDYPIIIKFVDVDIVDIPEHSITPTTEPIPGSLFVGNWQGIDPVDNSKTSLILTQTGNQLEGIFSDTFSEQPDGTLIQPGFSGQGSGNFVSPTEANMVFDLTRSDGARIQLDMRLVISLQGSTLTLEIPQQPPFVLHRQE